MDAEGRVMLRETLAAWCGRNTRRFERMERGVLDADLWDGLHADLSELGALAILHDRETRHDLATVAEVANGLAQGSPSLALLVLEQNLAAWLLGEAGEPLPGGWLSLPLYDGSAEWPHRIRVEPQADGYVLEGTWGLVPGLPVASTLLLPLVPAGADSFALVRVDLAADGHCRGRAVPTLGLRGCPVADATFARDRTAQGAVLARGRDAYARTRALWSQAELLVQAVRSAIVERSYAVARAHAEGRWQGKKLIVEHSLVQRLLADLYGAKCALEEEWRGVLPSLDPGRPLSAGQASAAARAATTAPRLASEGLQLLGGYGYVEEYGQERLFRDAKQCEMLLGHPQAKRFALWEDEPHASAYGG